MKNRHANVTYPALMLLSLMSITACNDKSSAEKEQSEKIELVERVNQAEKQTDSENQISNGDAEIKSMADAIRHKNKDNANDMAKTSTSTASDLPKNIRINEKKFQIFDWPLVKNSKVFNLQMNEYGKLKGTFVIVLKDEQLMPEDVNQQFVTKKIAKQTFQLTPKFEYSKNLIATYKKLMVNNFQVVEMQIDYSPENTRAIY